MKCLESLDYKEKIKTYINSEIEAIKKIDVNKINAVINTLESTRLKGGKIYICGNGGSATTASHFCCDFNKGVSAAKKIPYHFICLSDNVATLTAIANDESYNDVFSYQLNKFANEDDVLIVISGSGNSKNIVSAIDAAKAKNIFIIGLCGFDGGYVKKHSDLYIHIDVNNMQIIEDLHLMIDHCMMSILSSINGM